MWFARVSASSCHSISDIRVGMKAVPNRGDDKVFGLVLLEHEPLHFYIVFCMSPIP